MVAEYNGSENEGFSRQTIQGRPKKGLDHNVVELVHKFVMSANVSGSPHPNLLAIRDKLLHAFKEKVTSKNIRIQVIRYWLKVIMKILKSEKLNVNIFL